MDRDAVSFDPAVQNANQAASVVYDSLMRLTPSGEVEPYLAQSMESPMTADVAMGLRPGVRFQDGTDFDANAVVVNVQRHIDTVSSPAHAARRADHVDAVGGPADRRVRAREPMGEFPTVFALSFTDGTLGMVVSPAALQKYGATSAAIRSAPARSRSSNGSGLEHHVRPQRQLLAGGPALSRRHRVPAAP